MRRVALPEELKDAILAYACTLPPHKDVPKEAGFVVQDVHMSDLFGRAEQGVAQPSSGGLLFPAPARAAPPCPTHTLDIDVTCRVMLLSRHYYALGAQLLYRAPVLARPSKLEQFARTLVERPVLGHLVRHMYVGTTAQRTELPVTFFHGGMASYEQGLDLTPESARCIEAGAHPCEPRGSLLPHIIERDVGEICALFLGPPGAHGFDIFRPGFDREDEWIGIGAWVLRLHEARCLLHWLRALAYHERFETIANIHDAGTSGAELASLRSEAEQAGAALAAFLEEHRDDTHPLLQRRTGTRHDPLDWASASTLPAPLPEGLPLEVHEVVVVLQWRILTSWPHEWCEAVPHWLCAALASAIAYGRYLGMTANEAQRLEIRNDPFTNDPRICCAKQVGTVFFAPCDRFDDPCLYARSGVMHFLVGDEFAAPDHAAVPEQDDFWAQPARATDGEALVPTVDQLVVGSFAPRPLGLLPHLLHIPSDAPQAPTHQPPCPSPPTLGSLIATVQCTLCYTSQLQSLGLSGVLERAIAGKRTSTPLPRLERVFLGPPPPYWARPLQFGPRDHPAFAHVHHISITGCLLFEHEAAALAGAFNALPSLESVTWSMYHCTWEDGARSVITAIETMLDLPFRYESTLTITNHGWTRRGIPNLRVILHAVDYEAVRTNAPTHLLANPRLILEAAPRHCTGQHHAIFDDWAAHALR